MKHAAFATAVAVLLAAPAIAQQPTAPRDTSRHEMMMEHQMPAQGAAGMHRGMGGMGGGQGSGTGCGMMRGGMGHDSAMGGMMMDGMMREMAGAADHVLARKAALGLSADQERRLTAIRDAARAAHDAAARDAVTHRRELDEVMRAAAPDTAAMKHHFDGAHAAMGQAHLAMLRSAALARAVLTDAQRRQFDSLGTAMGCGMMGTGGAAQPAHRH